jgi:hypothetical protein
VPLDSHESSVLGQWYNAVGHYLRGDISYDSNGQQIDYGARIEALAGETVGGDRLETRLDVIEMYAVRDEIPDGPYDI